MRRPPQPRPSILEAVPDHGHVVLEASAGTGKTYTLEHLVLQLLLDGAIDLEELLIVTFTEKATEELRSRLRERFLELAAADEHALAVAGWSLGPEERRRLEEALARVDELHVSTIHGFCQGLLHDLAFRHRRLFHQELVDGNRLLRESFREIFRRTLGGDTPLAAATESRLLEGARVQQLEELAVKAAAFRHGVVTPIWEPEGLPSRVAETAAALRDPAWRRLAGGDAAPAWAETLETLERPGDPLALSLAWLEASELEAGDAFRQALSRGGSPAACDLLARIDGLDQRVGDPDALVASGYRQPVLEEVRSRKASRGWYDFDDMLELVAAALRRPDGDVRRAVRERFRCALIDEFQDTDPVQWEIFRHLFPPGDPERRLVLIGDPKQSIYGFRNADLTVYQRARDAIADAGGSVHALEQNFRSTPRMLEAHDRLFERFFDPGIDYHPSRAGRPGLRLVRGNGHGPEPPPIVVLRPFRAGGGGPPYPNQILRAVLAEAAVEIRKIVENGALRVREGEAEPLPIRYRDVQILARKNHEVLAAAEALGAAGIPFTLYRQEGLFQTPEAAQILDVLRAIARPEDRKARLKAWLTPFFGVPIERIPDARQAPADHPVHARLERWRRQAEGGDLPGLFSSLLRDSGLARRLLFARDDERSLTDFEHVLEVLAQEARRGARTLPELIRLLDDYHEGRSQPAGVDGNVQRLEGDRDAVQLLTMHKAKGLEATVVFLLGGLSGRRRRDGDLSPYRIADERRAHLGRARGALLERIEEEERREDQRLLYVAVTRARARLYLPWAGPKETTSRGDFGCRSRIDGSYRVLEERLTDLLHEPRSAPPTLFEIRDLPAGEDAPGDRYVGPAEPPPLSRLEREQLETETDGVAAEVASLRYERAAIVVTSYTRLARQAGAGRPADYAIPPDIADEVEDTEAVDDDVLPGGIGTGLALHEILETVDFSRVLAARDLDTWRQDRAADELVRRVGRRRGLERAHVPRLQALVWRALRTPLALGQLSLPHGLAAVTRREAEMEFLYPIPEGDHPPLGSAPPDGGPFPFRVQRGYLQGVVDLLFEHDDRIYFLDWKSDRRSDYSAAALTEHVERHYGLQRRLYTLAVLRATHLYEEPRYERRFGGLLYCFLRGLERTEDGLHGVVFERPAWSAVAAWERSLLERRYPGAVEAIP